MKRHNYYQVDPTEIQKTSDGKGIIVTGNVNLCGVNVGTIQIVIPERIGMTEGHLMMEACQHELYNPRAWHVGVPCCPVCGRQMKTYSYQIYTQLFLTQDEIEYCNSIVNADTRRWKTPAEKREEYIIAARERLEKEIKNQY